MIGIGAYLKYSLKLDIEPDNSRQGTAMIV